MRSMAMLVIAVFLAASATADARDIRKPRHHHWHFSAWNVHRPNSVVERQKANPVSVKQHPETNPLQPIFDFFQRGLASIWAGGRTSDGKHVRPSDMACAHRTLPLGTVIHVTNERTGKSILVSVRDRGPYKRGRIIDLTPTAASALGFGRHAGIARVTLNSVRPRRAPEHVIYD